MKLSFVGHQAIPCGWFWCFDCEVFATMMCVGCIVSSFDDEGFLARLFFGGIRMESGFYHFVFRCGVHSGKGLVHLVLCMVERLLVV